jgi:hypothetical protein
MGRAVHYFRATCLYAGDDYLSAERLPTSCLSVRSEPVFRVVYNAFQKGGVSTK